MSGAGFDADWLELRAPFDAAAGRSAGPSALSRAFGAALRTRRERGALNLYDLGCGSGANIARLAPRIPGSQHWTAIDSDPALLARVEATVTAWARSIGAQSGCSGPGGTLSVTTPQRIVSVETRLADLRDGLGGLDIGAADGVTGSALLDLVSHAWLDEAVAALAHHRLPALFTLNVDGRLDWQPPAGDDEAMAAAFFRDMRRDKGFGPALGSAACEVAAALFAARGHRVETAAADWQVRPGDAAMLAAQQAFVAEAARAQPPAGCDPAAWQQTVDAWNAGKTAEIGASALALTVGHRDLLAVT